MLSELLRSIFEPTILNDDVISVIASFGYRPPERYGVKALLHDFYTDPVTEDDKRVFMNRMSVRPLQSQERLRLEYKYLRYACMTQMFHRYKYFIERINTTKWERLSKYKERLIRYGSRYRHHDYIEDNLYELLQRKSWHRHFPRLTEKANILSTLLDVKLVKRTKYISKERFEFINWFKLDGLVNGHQHRLVNAFLL